MTVVECSTRFSLRLFNMAFNDQLNTDRSYVSGVNMNTYPDAQNMRETKVKLVA